MPYNVFVVHAFHEQEPTGRQIFGHPGYLTSMPWSATVWSSVSEYSTART